MMIALTFISDNVVISFNIIAWRRIVASSTLFHQNLMLFNQQSGATCMSMTSIYIRIRVNVHVYFHVHVHNHVYFKVPVHVLSMSLFMSLSMSMTISMSMPMSGTSIMMLPSMLCQHTFRPCMIQPRMVHPYFFRSPYVSSLENSKDCDVFLIAWQFSNTQQNPSNPYVVGCLS